MINNVFQVIVILSLTGTILSIPLILLKNVILKRYDGNWYYYVWLVVLVMYILPIGQAAQLFKPSTINVGTQMIKATNNETMAMLNQSITQFIYDTTHRQDISLIWLFGIAVSLAYSVFVSHLFSQRIIAKSKRITNDQVVEIMQNAIGKMKIKHNIKLRSCSEICSPMIVGIWKPTIILPTVVLLYPATDFELIIMHELTHYKNKDIWYKYFVVLIKSIHWFNPFLYIIAKVISESCEYACDYRLTKQMGNQFSARYANMILNVMQISVLSRQQPSYVSATLYKNRKNIKRRFELIMMKSNNKKVGITTFVLAAVLGFSTFTVMAFGAAEKSEAKHRIILEDGAEFEIDNADGSGEFVAKDGSIVSFQVNPDAVFDIIPPDIDIQEVIENGAVGEFHDISGIER
ncbi:MAG: M56 family metallopeptidase [Lachnospiraceae bacterium]